jgi:hypothetical protein
MRYTWTRAPEDGTRWRDMTWRERAEVAAVLAGILALFLAGSSQGPVL